MRYAAELPIEGNWDLIVAGAGPAGCAAALAAGRRGRRVLLLEAGTRPGGMGTAGCVSSFAPMSDGERCVAGGIALELVEALHGRGALGPQVTEEYWRRAEQRWIPFRPEELVLLYDELLAAAGVEVRYGCRVVDALRGEGPDGPIGAVVAADVEGLRALSAAAFIDATGDAALCAAAGYPVRRAGRDTERIMPPTLCALFSGIRWEGMPMSPSGNCPARQQEMLERALEDGRFSRRDLQLPGLYRIGPGLGMMNAGHLFNTDAVDERSLSGAYAAGRAQVREYLAFYREYVPGCEDMQLVATAPLLGIRESRRIVGIAELRYEDYRRRARFGDGIGLCSGSVDIHVYDDSPEEYERYYREFNERDRMGRGESLGIPYGVLVPRGSRNLWAAGRCVSADVKVQGALRIQPAAAVMGEAAGMAVDLALESGLPAADMDVAELRRRLAAVGAVLE